MTDREKDFLELQIAYKETDEMISSWKGVGDYGEVIKKSDQFDLLLDNYKRKHNPVGFYLKSGLLYER